MTKLTRTRLLATTMIVGAASIAAPLSAQVNSADQPGNPVTQQTEAGASTGPIEGQTPASGAPLQSGDNGDNGAIVVTGSRIPQPNLTSAAPVTVVTAQELKLQGTTSVENLLNTLPQVTADQNSGVSNGSTGTATVSLRDLGPERTLVLVNGRRLLPGDPTSSAADVNVIPSSLVKSVQVLTGGASSTYGADAVAGVVNFILDTDYTGFKLDGQYSFFQHSNGSNVLRSGVDARAAQGLAGFSSPTGNTVDGGNIDVTATVGGGFDDDKGHVVAYFGYRHQSAVLESSRDYAACSASDLGLGFEGCGGSSTSATGRFAVSGTAAQGGGTYSVQNGNSFTAGTQPYNYQPTNYYERPDERYTAGFFAHYNISDSFKPYAEFMFMDDRTLAQIAPSGDFSNTLSVNCNNPLLSAQQLGIVCAPNNLVSGFVGAYPLTARTGGGATPITFSDPVTGATYNRGFLQIGRRNVEGGGRVDDLEHTEYRAVLGMSGDIAPGLSYNGYYQYGRTLFQETYLNDFSISRLTNALDVITGPNGQPECRSVETGSDRNCVPYNVFTAGGVTNAATGYLSTPGFQRGINTEQVVHLDVTAQLGQYGLKSPFADDGLAINFGGEYRRETLNLRTDEEFQLGDLAGQGAATLPVSGSFDVKEGFVEGQLPIVHDRFIYDLTLSAGYRYSSYSTGYNTNTYKFEATFSPIRDITFRGAYNRAVRAPNLQDLFAPAHVALDGTSDPCAAGLTTYTAAQCALTGLSAAQYADGTNVRNPAGQYNGLIGGSTSLRPEKATTKTAGIVLQPRFARRLALTADYYDIKVDSAIQEFGENAILNTCATTGEADVCSRIHRNPVTGSLWLTPDGYVDDRELNVGYVRTKGVDFSGSYVMDIGRFGSLGFNLTGTYLDKFVTNNGISTPYDCKGYYGGTCGSPLPKWKGKARVSYTAPKGFGLSAQWRYVGHVNSDATSSNPTLSQGVIGEDFTAFSSHIKAQSYFDLAATATISDHYNVRVGVNNIADKRPPVVDISNCLGTFCNGNTYPGVYDFLGRYIYAAATLEF